MITGLFQGHHVYSWQTSDYFVLMRFDNLAPSISSSSASISAALPSTTMSVGTSIRDEELTKAAREEIQRLREGNVQKQMPQRGSSI